MEGGISSEISHSIKHKTTAVLDNLFGDHLTHVSTCSIHNSVGFYSHVQSTVSAAVAAMHSLLFRMHAKCSTYLSLETSGTKLL